LSARFEFDKTRAYFEIDAPQTTVSVRKRECIAWTPETKTKAEVRVSVTEAGQARVYSENSGFTLRNGRSARVQISTEITRANGKPETRSKYADDFDSWSLQRDAIIAKRLRKRVLRQILRPRHLRRGRFERIRRMDLHAQIRLRLATLPEFRRRLRRLVAVSLRTLALDSAIRLDVGQRRALGLGDISSRALGLGRRRVGLDALRSTTIINNNTTVIVNNPPVVTNPNQPTVVAAAPNLTNEQRNARLRTSPLGRVPPSGVIAVDASEFGRRAGGFRVAPPETARTVLSKTPEVIDSSPLLPTLTDLNGRLSREILTAAPPVARTQTRARIGAGERESNGSLDGKLRKERIFGNRPPVVASPAQTETPIENGDIRENRRVRRPTGAVERAETNNSVEAETNRKQRVPYQPPVDQPSGVEDQKPVERVREKPARQRRENPNVDTAPPTYEAPRERPKERSKPPREEPRYEAPDTPREEPRPEPPPREERRDDPPPSKREEPRQESPKQRSDPPEERKTAPPNRGKNGRDGN
jgi:hypothetical protein